MEFLQLPIKTQPYLKVKRKIENVKVNFKKRRVSFSEKVVQEKSSLPFPLPPSTQTISGDEDCFENITTCSINSNDSYRPCFKCKQFNWICQNFKDSIKLDDDSIIPPNQNDDEGYCLPNFNIHETINSYTSQLVLINDTDGLYFAVQCKYPNIFSHTNILSNCSIFLNPCKTFSLYNNLTDEVYVEGTQINFDPFINGRCRVPSDSEYTATWSDLEGPGIKFKLFYEREQSNCPDFTNKNTLSELTAAGYKNSIASYFSTFPNTICLPTPCKYDVRNGIDVGGVWDSSLKACTCPPSRSLPVIEKQDAGGNVVDALEGYPNACISLGDVKRDDVLTNRVNFVEFGNVNYDSTPQTYVYVSLKEEFTRVVGSTKIIALYQRPAVWSYYTQLDNYTFGWDRRVANTPPYGTHFEVYKCTSNWRIVVAYDLFKKIIRTYQGDGESYEHWNYVIEPMNKRGDLNQSLGESGKCSVVVVGGLGAERPMLEYIKYNVAFLLVGGPTTMGGVYTSRAIVRNPSDQYNNITTLAIGETYTRANFGYDGREKTYTDTTVDSDLIYPLPI